MDLMRLTSLRGAAWAEPPFDSPMVKRIRALGQVPLREFMPEDYRLIISQQRAAEHACSARSRSAESDPFVEGDFYVGDLLLAVVKIRPEFWAVNQSLRARARRVLAAAIARLGELDEIERSTLVRLPAHESQLIIPGADSVLERTSAHLIKLTEARDSRGKDAPSAGSKRLIDCPRILAGSSATARSKSPNVEIAFNERIALQQIESGRNKRVQRALLGDDEAIVLWHEFAQRYLSQRADPLHHR